MSAKEVGNLCYDTRSKKEENTPEIFKKCTCDR